MPVIKERISRLEKELKTTDRIITDVRKATDAQLESYLRSVGIDPNDDTALARAAPPYHPKRVWSQ